MGIPPDLISEIAQLAGDRASIALIAARSKGHMIGSIHL
jgi:hypothetical protein